CIENIHRKTEMTEGIHSTEPWTILQGGFVKLIFRTTTTIYISISHIVCTMLTPTLLSYAVLGPHIEYTGTSLGSTSAGPAAWFFSSRRYLVMLQATSFYHILT
ncbi:hypothetical protein ACJX0J_032076, partial [Zea mays]